MNEYEFEFEFEYGYGYDKHKKKILETIKKLDQYEYDHKFEYEIWPRSQTFFSLELKKVFTKRLCPNSKARKNQIAAAPWMNGLLLYE